MSTIRHDHSVNADSVLCRIHDAADIKAFAEQLEPLFHIGFTGMIISQESIDDHPPAIEACVQGGFTVHIDKNLGTALDLMKFGSQANHLWSELDHSPQFTLGPDLSAEPLRTRSQNESRTLLQMSVPPTPIVSVTRQLVYSNVLREQRALLRSLVFWRKRFDIASHRPKLVHAGEDGLLIFTTDSWLVTVNQNPEEASIDLGSHGSMWLMLGTQRDVHLHGSMLILPPFSGAIVANELAR